MHTFARHYEELTTDSTSRLIIDALTLYFPYGIPLFVREGSFLLFIFFFFYTYLILIHFSFLFSLPWPPFPSGWKEKKGGGCWWVVVVPAAGRRDWLLHGSRRRTLALLSRLFQLSTLSELSAAVIHTSRVSVLSTSPAD